MATITEIKDVKDLWVGEWDSTLVPDAQLTVFIQQLEDQAAYHIEGFAAKVILNQPPASIVKQVIAGAIVEYIISALTPYQSETQSNGVYSRSVSTSASYRKKLKLNDDELDLLSVGATNDDDAFMVNMGSPGRRRWRKNVGREYTLDEINEGYWR